MTFQLVIHHGDSQWTVPLAENRDFHIGRTADNDIQIDDEEVSSHHAVVRLRGETVEIKDLDSTNGTYLDEVRLTRTVDLVPGQSVRVGHHMIEIQKSTPSPRPPAIHTPTPMPNERHSNEKSATITVHGIAQLRRIGITIIIFICAASAVWFFSPDKKWEYMVVSVADRSFDAEMGQLGAAGWELVTARRASAESSSTFSYEMIFKRPKSVISSQPTTADSTTPRRGWNLFGVDKRSQAQTILNECRMLDAALDQYALENNKQQSSGVAFADLTPYLKAGSKLATNGGNDTLGNPFNIAGTISGSIKVNAKTKDSLSTVTGGDSFWGPYSESASRN